MTRSQTHHQELVEQSMTHLWLPFTQMKDYVQHPLVITHGEGVRLYDTLGNAYYDAFSSVWLNVHGHRKKQLDDAIVAQLGSIAHATLLGMANEPAVRLAKKICALAPKGLTRVYYSDSGAEAIEIALKIAFQYWYNIGQTNKKTFVSMEGNYHGDTIGSVSVGHIDRFHLLYRPLLFSSIRAPFPDVYRHPSHDAVTCRDECLAQLESIFAEKHHEIAAMVVEALVQGASGMRIMPAGFLRSIRELCTQYNILLICDEVATGFGRTGTMFACEQENVTPDLLAIAKGLTGGYLPVAATLTTERLYEAFYAEYTEGKTLFHGHSYTGNALGCAVALANLQLFEQENVLHHTQQMSLIVAKRLQSFWTLPAVGDIRQKGLMVGIELVADRHTKRPYAPEQRIGYRATLRMRELGLLTRPLGDTIVFMPPLASTEEQLIAMLDIIYTAIEDVTSQPVASI